MSSPEPTPNQVEGAMPSPEPNPNQVEGACLALSLPLTRWRVLCRACPRVRPSHSAAPSPCCRPRYRLGPDYPYPDRLGPDDDRRPIGWGPTTYRLL